VNFAAAVFTVALTVAGIASGAEQFSFDASEFEKKIFDTSGYLEEKLEAMSLRGDAPAYRLGYPGKPARKSLVRSTTTLEASARLNLDAFVADLRAQAVSAHDALTDTRSEATVMDSGVRWSAGPGYVVDIGKRVQRWGKGYAWSPVGFIERPRDANDPQASREGFVMASGEWTKRFESPVSTVGITGLIVPTSGRINTDFGQTGHVNPAAKLYLLALDTDLDLLWRGKGARPQSFGVDFSRNISSALEVHGEWARTLAAPRNTVTASGVTRSAQANADAWLLGLRYLTGGEVTWIVEYYRNGNGFSARELDAYGEFLAYALAPGAGAALENKARAVAQSGYGRPNPGRDYLYLKASVSEPFGWVYGAAALTAMSNVHDGSWQLTPEVSYSGLAGVELRARLVLLAGPAHAEFAEKAVRNRLELQARFFF